LKPISLTVPGDKSISHRALIFAALAEGRSNLRHILESDDIKSTAAVLRTLGVAVPQLSAHIKFDGVGLRGLQAPGTDLDCGNSGTTARLMAGVVAAMPFASRLVGDASLSKRPMRRLAASLEQMGANFTFQNPDGLPLTVQGGSLGEFHFVNKSASAQLKSSLLLAGLVSGSPVQVLEPRPSRNHTEVMLQALGADIVHKSGLALIRASRRISPLDARIPGDPSSAAFFAALAAMLPGSSITANAVCLSPTRLGFFTALQQMGAKVEFHSAERLAIGELAGDIQVEGRELTAITLAANDVPALVDELPLLACVATRAKGETRVSGAEELRLKESDRISTIVSNLQRIGASAEELDDGFVVRGTDSKLKGTVVTRGDHRIAMAFGILGAVHGNEIEVDDLQCASVSYPGFWEQLAAVHLN
jgi:3-phosphoshikimate 1-carboxyvinyltransferase